MTVLVGEMNGSFKKVGAPFSGRMAELQSLVEIRSSVLFRKFNGMDSKVVLLKKRMEGVYFFSTSKEYDP